MKTISMNLKIDSELTHCTPSSHTLICFIQMFAYSICVLSSPHLLDIELVMCSSFPLNMYNFLYGMNVCVDVSIYVLLLA